VIVIMCCLFSRVNKARRAGLCYWWPQWRGREGTILANGDAINRSPTTAEATILNGRWVRIICHFPSYGKFSTLTEIAVSFSIESF